VADTSGWRGGAGGKAGALVIQGRVIGALILRELHTRFGRDNIGYLWFIAEPMMLAAGVSAAHLAARVPLASHMDIVPFYVTGYCTFMMFRSNVNRAAATIESNRSLLFHRQVTPFDMVISRCLLEAAAVLSAMLLLLGLASVTGLGHMPDRPQLILAGMGLMLWFTIGLAMIVAAASEFTSVVERLVHPTTYLLLPVSGMFFLIEWVPKSFQPYVALFPPAQLTEMVRLGEFAQLQSKWINVPYLIAVNAVLTLVGLAFLRLARNATPE
jgi:capsular polysaccharide transport system permease protein